jgi:hypothetical protein
MEQRIRETEDRPHACTDGWVYLSFMAHGEDTGEEQPFEEVLPCRRCALAAEVRRTS